MNRRHFLRTSTAAAAAAAVLGPGASRALAAARGAGVPADLGIQLYMVRDVLHEDMVGTLETLRRMGYTQVEAKFMHGREPADVRALLDALDLTCPSFHADLGPMRDDLDGVLATATVLGAEYLTLAWFPEDLRPATLDGWQRLGEEINGFAQRAADAGLQFAYHNHEFEFATYGGDRPAYDVLLDTVDPALVDFELDHYWVTFAGYDPLAYMRDHPGRFPLWHLKDAAADRSITSVGSGSLDWEAIFAFADTAGLRYVFVDAEDTGRDLATARESIDYFTSLR